MISGSSAFSKISLNIWKFTDQVLLKLGVENFENYFTSLLAAAAAAAKLLQSCLALRDPIDSRPPGSTVPGILQARTMGWVAVSFSNA